eukprot:scaffold8939_cov108-Cylindrotheca_fusiformis.AAC.1
MLRSGLVAFAVPSPRSIAVIANRPPLSPPTNLMPPTGTAPINLRVGTVFGTIAVLLIVALQLSKREKHMGCGSGNGTRKGRRETAIM